MFRYVFRPFARPTNRTTARRPTRTASLKVEALDDRITPSLDQVFDPPASGSNNYFSTSAAWFNTNQEEAQTFTCGMTGTLAEVDLYISRFDSNNVGDLIVDIRACQADGRPTSTGDPLASATVPAASVPGNPAAFFAVDFSAANLSVTSGEQLAVVIHVANDPGANVTYYWEGRSGNLYTGGGFTDRVIGNYDWQNISTDGDLGFKTFVDAGASQPPVVTLPGGPVNYTAGQPPVVLSPSATVTDPDSANFDTGTLTVSLTANGTVDDRLGIQDQGTGPGQIGVSGTTVTYGGTAIGTFAGGVGLTPLVVTLNANATPAATQALAENLTFNDVAASPVTGSRTVQVVLTDGGGGTSTPATTTVNVSAADQPPTVTTNTGLTVAEGGSGVITQADLETTDPDNSPDQLTYTATAGPAHGTLLLNGTAATTFTQADINAGNVSYLNNGRVNTSDAFTFTVSDGQLSTASTTFNIVVTTVNNPPTVMTNAGLIVAKGSSAVIGHAALDTADPDNTSSQLVYTISAAPTHGTLQLGGQAVTTFTQADLDAGRVSYVNDGSAATTDGFTFTVSDGTVSTGSAAFAIAVDTVPQVTLSPADTSAFAGSPVALTAAATGITAPTVQWQVKAPGGSFADIPGATATTYTFLPTVADDGDQYQAVFTNPVGGATTTAATLTVKPGLVILTEPALQTVPLGQMGTFTAGATGSTRVAVQWQVSTDGGLTYSNITGATRPTLTVTKVSAALDGALYRAVFRDAAGQAPSATATLTVNYTVTLAGKRAIAVRPGTAVTLAAQAKTAPTAVQWQVSTDLGHTWTAIAGATGVTYTFTATAGDSGHLFRAQVTSGSKTSFSPPATLTVTDPPALMSSPTDQTGAISQSVVFSAAASALGVKLQWQVSTDGGKTFTAVRGATKTALVLKNLTAAMNGLVYRAVFTNAVGVTESATATLTVT
jgi:hypothetical protein